MRHWVFDFDGTLVDTDGLFTRCVSHALEPYGVKVPENFIEIIRHKHPNKIFEDYLTEEQSAVALKRLRLINQELDSEIRVFPGIADSLAHLEKSKVSLSIWTGRDGESTKRILKATGLDSFFAHVVSGTCVEVNKPGHDGLLLLKDQFDAQTDQMVMVGDHHHDIEPANTLGLTSIHAQWKPLVHQLPLQVAPDYSFDCSKKFRDWVLTKK